LRVRWVLIAAALIVAVSAMLAQLTSAQTPTPSAAPTDTPSLSPSPTQYLPKSTITIRFVSGGQPATISVGVPKTYADGVFCDFPTTGQPAEPRSQVSYPWPPNPSPNFAPECTKGPPTHLRFDFGSFVADVSWTGSDITIDVEVPAPSQTAIPAPVLPKTGGLPGHNDISTLWELAAAGVVILLGVLWLAKFRHGGLLCVCALALMLVRGSAVPFGAVAELQSTVSAQPTPQIFKIEPAAAEPWSYVVITGSNLTRADGSCELTIGGAASFVADCSASQVRAIVPWQAANGGVTVRGPAGANGTANFELLPLRMTDRKILPGHIAVQTRSGGEAAGVAASLGDRADSVTRMGDSTSPFMKDWYQIGVPVGSEFAKAFSYSADNDILYAAPVPMPESADTPNDPCYPSPRLQQRPVQSNTGQWALAKIQAATAWSNSKGVGVKIAVIDTGFATSHAGLADRVEVELSYAIGHPQPIGVSVESFGTQKFDHDGILRLVRESFDLSPTGIIRDLRLRRPIYLPTASYGHFGRTDIDAPWEATDRAEELRKAAGLGEKQPA